MLSIIKDKLKNKSKYMKNKHLVIGRGEVGKAVAKVFDCQAIDIDYGGGLGEYDFIHICFPYVHNFISEVKIYKEQFNAKYVIIHSTVPIGTTNKIVGAVHSPIRGVHPNLEEGVRTFVKYIGYNDVAIGDAVYNEFIKFNIYPVVVDNSNNTEAGKLLSTTYYGWNIIFEKWVHEYCKKHMLDFDTIYDDFNMTYNKGYGELGMPNVVRPVLNHHEGKIGGHCVTANCEILDDFEPAQIILTKNEIL